MAWSPIVTLDSILTGVDTTVPIRGHTLHLGQAPNNRQQLSVTLELMPCTARQFDYHMVAGRELVVQLAARAVAMAVIDGIDGQYLREDAWDRCVVVKYTVMTFRGQARSHTMWVYKE